jgi:hypothetical protein
MIQMYGSAGRDGNEEMHKEQDEGKKEERWRGEWRDPRSNVR